MRNELADALCLPLEAGVKFTSIIPLIRYRRLLVVAFLFVVALGNSALSYQRPAFKTFTLLGNIAL
jgi:hypothetical protein